ncbi:YMGG-like glycine zipper-containing protein [Pseudogemmobacter blasticus]|uniref:YMGG-like Gly-zipper domain-containing protein n=1 Tax=Fuscovulum blasticum DSM 2131 TaxID=1188250 RepID=A0A2T4J8L6_FUSBL|nr:YMGG-like glycine zipper-containing protein [Fuscovulum blasticum]PTE14256.1 hypothetical protein C5F44_09645 [Fuscovulum blasticum DSM 2131]
MKALLLALPVAALALSACTTTPEQNTMLGAVGGAAAGYAVSSDSDKTKGALVGAAVGAVAGTFLGKTSTPGQCYYRNSAGQTYIAAC